MQYPEQSIKKILMTADSVGGVWIYALDLCRALQAFDIKVCLAVMGAPLSASQQHEAGTLHNVDIRESCFKLEWMENPWEDVERAGEWLLQLEKAFEPDVIHLNGFCHANLQWNSPVIVVAHSCVLSWFNGVKNIPAPAEFSEYKHRVTRALRSADSVVSVSHSYAADLRKLYGFSGPVSVIYNGRDEHSFYSAEKKKQVFAMGRIWDEAKNLALLGRISNKVNFRILVAGNNHHPGTTSVVKVSNVQLLGVLTQPEVKHYLAESSIYVLPAKYEPFGLSVLEAALSGCVLLLADIPTLRELWQNTALYFNPDKPEELDHLLETLAKNPEVGRRMTERSSARARLFSSATMANSYLTLYRSLKQKQLITEYSN
jgi:glycosyltransferase involved in cell wall biosynthesis